MRENAQEEILAGAKNKGRLGEWGESEIGAKQMYLGLHRGEAPKTATRTKGAKRKRKRANMNITREPKRAENDKNGNNNKFQTRKTLQIAQNHRCAEPWVIRTFR